MAQAWQTETENVKKIAKDGCHTDNEDTNCKHFIPDHHHYTTATAAGDTRLSQCRC
jgi:hypothetical protein